MPQYHTNKGKNSIGKNRISNMYFTGIIIAVSTFFIIGIFHPVVIKAEYHWGTRPWLAFLLVGVVSLMAALFISHVVVSSLLGVFGASSLWAIGELFAQKKRVAKGWFPMNPRRRHEYEPIDRNETLCPVHHGRSIYAIDDDQAPTAATHEDSADSGR